MAYSLQKLFQFQLLKKIKMEMKQKLLLVKMEVLETLVLKLSPN